MRHLRALRPTVPPAGNVDPRRSSFAWRLFWWVLGLSLFVLFLFRAWKAGNNDFIAYCEAGARALRGESLYRIEETPFRYLPITAFFFAPLSWLDFKSARILFFVLNFAAVVAVYRRIHARLGDLATLAIAIFFFRFHNHDFQNAQVNSLLLLLFFSWWSARSHRLSSATLAFAVFGSFKLVPFALGLPLLLLRRGKEIAWIAAWTLGLNLLPVLFFDSGFGIFAEWFSHSKNIGYPAAMMSNIQSLQSALWWNLQDRIPKDAFALGMHVLQLGLVFATWAICPKPRLPREDWILSAALATTVLISPLAWKHNYLQFLPLIFLVVRSDPRIRSASTRAYLAVGFLGMVAIPSLAAKVNRELSDRMYLMVWTGLVLVFWAFKYSRSRNAA